MRNRRFQIPLLIASIYGLIVLPLGIYLWTLAVDSLPSDSSRLLRLVHEQIEKDYVEEIDEQELVFGAVKGMVENLDRWGTFVGPKKAHQFDQNQLEGTYSGIGVLLVDGEPRILSPLSGGPAEQVGLEVGDRFLEVGGQPVPPKEEANLTDWLRELLTGLSGETIELVIERDDERIPFTVQRGEVRNPRVLWAHLLDEERKIGYLHVRGFQRNVRQEFDQSIARLEEQAGGALGGLVIDLRFNPGGLLDEAVEMTNRFVSEGRIVTQRGREAIVEVHDADPNLCTHPDLPLAILVNGTTASASELMSAALQDHDRAVIVGSRSYGKGAVQSVFRWEDRDYRLKLTTSLYYPPSDRVIDRHHAEDKRGGIVPDIEVQVNNALLRDIDAMLGRVEVPYYYRERVLELGLPVPPTPDPSFDPQLAAALEALRGD
ncbi:MAG: S41 family peptidase [Planctomycetota bacterium]